MTIVGNAFGLVLASYTMYLTTPLAPLVKPASFQRFTVKITLQSLANTTWLGKPCALEAIMFATSAWLLLLFMIA